MNVFIIRPFGCKEQIDFDLIDDTLIQPALMSLNIVGGTAGTVIHAGNIRTDMFEQLLMADLVIVDITIHNANVFYELGIRQALRDKFTFMIKGTWNNKRMQKRVKDVPFDLKTDRYMEYEIDHPENSIQKLTSGLKATIKNEFPDSPIFFSLPNLKPQSTETFLAIPTDFGEEVEEAKMRKKYYHKIGRLSLLAHEVETYPWRTPALRLIGECLYREKAYDLAKTVWEKVRASKDNINDIQANDRLSNIYQRLSEKDHETEWESFLVKSDHSLERLSKQNNKLNKQQRAEVLSLTARNLKFRWVKLWEQVKGDERIRLALSSSLLKESFEKYKAGYYEDLNHYYAGINALWMANIISLLAKRNPEIWLNSHSTKKAAITLLKDIEDSIKKISVCLQVSLEAADLQWNAKSGDIPWHQISRADLVCLTEHNPNRVANLYSDIFSRIPAFSTEAIIRQLKLVKNIGILNENVDAVLKNIPDIQQSVTHFILFTGHMIDAPDREIPRFPPNMEEAAKSAIKSKIYDLINDTGDKEFIGIAGGASGGDILFHETCRELGVKSELFLIGNRDAFVSESVAPAGSNWITRFNNIFQNTHHQYLMDGIRLPNWLRNKSNYSIWERNNLWMLYTALSNGPQNTTLIALWDNQLGDGAGGTEHLVKYTKEFGICSLLIDINNL